MTQPIGPVMLDLAGPRLSREESDMLKRPEVGGVILFARNTHDAAQVQALCASIRRVRSDLLIAIDQEGGRVQRLHEGVTRIPSMAQLAAGYEEDPQAIQQQCQDAGWLLGMEMAACGLDVTFAPVLDVDGGDFTVIGDRSLSSDPQVVTQLGSAFISGLHDAGMVAVGKHYPGHGGVVADSHYEQPVDPRPLATLREHDMRPFAELAPRLEGVMPSHVIYSAFDDKPAGFSRSWLGLLREELGFKGAIFSDDLSMVAARFAGSPAEAALKALDAGCDMVLVCNDREGAIEALDACCGRASIRPAKLRYRRARPTLEALPALARWRRVHARLEALCTSAADGAAD